MELITNFEKSNEYRNTIHDLIPGGAHTYSKGDDQFPILSPAAIEYGKGAYVWDLDGNKYLDCSLGLSSVSLGHAYEPVLKVVKDELDKGVNFQRPSIIEKKMAEKFLSLIPSHDMIKFAKNGSAVTTAAVKLARAYTGRNIIVYPKGHPFYSYDDWFISSTDCNKGIPNEVVNYTLTFDPFDLESLNDIFNKYPDQIACVITEPEKSNEVSDNELFLKEAINLSHENGALFILDEMVTGFKTDFPGSMTKFGITPDLATWGKGIANGFSFCALTGTEKIMSLGGIKNVGTEKVFLVSTTHGGETHAIAACLATIEEFEKHDVIKYNHSLGHQLITMINDVVSRFEMMDYIKVSNCLWMPTFSFFNSQKQADAGYRTLMMQEMIKRGILFQGVFIPCFSHSNEDIIFFIKAFEESLKVYKEAIRDGFSQFLIGEPTKPVFRKFI